MKTNNQMPGNDRDYPESDISDKQKQTAKQRGDKPRPAQNDKEELKAEDNGTYIKDMPEIVPARVGVI